jgi:hypothetical protein
LLAVRAKLYKKVPAVDASQTEKCVIVSGDVPAHDAQTGNVAASAQDPPDAAENVIAGRVVTDDGAVVAAAPGSAVWSLAKFPAGAVLAVARNIWSKTLFANATVTRPTVMGWSPLRRRSGRV